ncbi:MAG: ferritin-like domain-containing protein [Gaiellaceae bacterium]
MTFRDIPDLALDDLDRDGAIREALDRLPRSSRGGFLKAGSGILAAVALGRPPTASAALRAGDVAILNYALALEYLQDAFYTEAERKGALSGPAARLTRVVGAVERAHVRALRDVLGKKAIARPYFDFRGVTEKASSFIRTAVAFEDLGTAAYKGQAHNIQSPQVLAAAVGIHTVEARHAAWIRYIAGSRPAAEAFDQATSEAQTLRLVRNTGFIARRPRTRAKKNKKPAFTG